MEYRGNISRNKTKYLSFNEDQDCDITTQEITLKVMHKFKYPASVVTEDGNLDNEIAHRIQACLLYTSRCV